MPPIEEKNIFRYKIRKRIDRAGRILLEKIFADDEFMIKDFENERTLRAPCIRYPTLPSEILEKIPQSK